MPENPDNRKVAIIGAGPAGIAAAIQLKRCGIEPLVFEKRMIGGLLNNANRVENYPGFPRGIAGPALVCLFQEQAQKAGVAARHMRVDRVVFRRRYFYIQTSGGNFRSEILVIASGTRPKRMTDVHVAEPALGKIHYEVYPIRHAVKKKVIIIGGGDAAFDYALNLARRNKVVILNRSAQTRCLLILQKQVGNDRNIEYVPGIRVLGIAPAGRMLKANCSNGKKIIADHVLIAVGREPDMNFLSLGIMKDKLELVRQKKLYIIGDAGNGMYRQTAIAVGDGIRAGMEIKERMVEVHRRKGAEEKR